MPATESTWRNLKTLHVVFAVSSLVMLVATVVMLAADHNREWKTYQRTSRSRDTETNDARVVEQKTAAYSEQHDSLARALTAERLKVDDPQLPQAYAKFRALVQDYTKDWNENLEKWKKAGATQVEKLPEFNFAAANTAFTDWSGWPADGNKPRDTNSLSDRALAARAKADEARKAADAARDAAQAAREKAATAEKAFAKDAEQLNTDAAKAGSDADAKRAVAQQADQEAHHAEDAAIKRRERWLDEIRDAIRKAKTREDRWATIVKFRKADYDEARSDYDLAVGNHASEADIKRAQDKAKAVEQSVGVLNLVKENAKDYRLSLDAQLRTMTDSEEKAKKAFDDNAGELARLVKAYDDRRGTFGRGILELPVLDAFSSPLKVEQIWLPNLTFNNNFKGVARFDRCTTCHQGIDKTAPGSAVDPLYPAREKDPRVVKLPTPSEPPKSVTNDQGVETGKTARAVYGLDIGSNATAAGGTEATIRVVWPNSVAAEAGLRGGDVIESINGNRVYTQAEAESYLLERPTWGQPLTLQVLRGAPQPFASHPRLDLFVGSLSPHPLQTFGCTACHDGQGSATAFKWAMHTPNDPEQEARWKKQYGYFHSHDWIYPMFPERFQESSCLKCHHEVVELEASPRFPDPPAEKLVEGYTIVRRYGCYGCHEINGYDGPTKRIGPDLRSEPNFFAAALQLKADPAFNKVGDDVQGWATQVAAHPEDDGARRRLREFLLSDRAAKEPLLSANSHKLEAVLKDVEAPGKLRKPGPSLRYLASKVDFEWLYNWIANPSDFRPDTRMPRFFGQHGHLTASQSIEPKGLEEAVKFEPIEIRAATEYLLTGSQPFTFVTPAAKPDAERGKSAFQKRGCLACHTHKDFPEAAQSLAKNEILQGPDLSRMGAKLKKQNDDGLNWLYSWVKEPNRYHARTVMPNLFLDATKDKDGNLIDPAADITLYLAKSQDDWKPAPVARQMTAQDKGVLRELARQYLLEKFSDSAVKKYLEAGIPTARAATLKGDEVALAFDAATAKSPEQVTQEMDKRLLDYIGRRTISKYGCSGCHDIPGYEDSKPIGTALADWGRKDPAKLAFEQINGYVTHGKSAEHTDEGHGSAEGSGAATDHGHGELGYFMERLLGHQREGFLWQKLREPRSYDYLKTENKRYNERLRMPQFTFAVDKNGHRDPQGNQAKIEAVMTFVLGLLSEPPPPEYVYNPTGRVKSIVRGRQVLEKYNCGGCHILQMQRWQIGFKEFPAQPEPAVKDYNFVNPHFTPEQLEASAKKDRAGRMHALLEGLPQLRESDGQPNRIDEDGSPIPDTDKTTPGMYTFNLYSPTLIGGNPYLVKVKDPLVQETQIERQYREVGGRLARLLYPVVVKEGKAVNSNLSAETTWGWLPPPLIGEGVKVQTKWLHDFLLDPYPIRPATVLRMPKFNMSSEEASALVAYFAAVDNAEAPFEFNPRASSAHLATARSDYAARVKKAGGSEDRTHLQDAMKIVTDNNYCVKCHLVGDFRPQGDDTALGPNLSQVQQRLRPEYLRRWLANPARLLPYTGMPVNIPADKPVSQELYVGTPLEQLDALVDLLMNFDQFSQERVSMKSLVKPAAPAPAAGSEEKKEGGN